VSSEGGQSGRKFCSNSFRPGSVSTVQAVPTLGGQGTVPTVGVGGTVPTVGVGGTVPTVGGRGTVPTVGYGNSLDPSGGTVPTPPGCRDYREPVRTPGRHPEPLGRRGSLSLASPWGHPGYPNLWVPLPVPTNCSNTGMKWCPTIFCCFICI